MAVLATNVSFLLLFVLCIPFAGAFLIWSAGERGYLREWATVLVAVLLFFNVCNIAYYHGGGGTLDLVLLEVLPMVALRFTIEPLGMAFALLASFLWMLTSLYAIGYMRANKEKNQTRFYSFMTMSIGAAIGIAFSGNLFTLFVCYEVLTLLTYPLVTHAGTDKAKEGGRTYLSILLLTSVSFLLLAIVGTWFVAGTTDFTAGGVLQGKADATITALLFLGFVFGTGKAAIFPFHRWLPAAMVAPTPVSALLHAVAVVKAGVFTIVKVVVYILGIDHLSALAPLGWWVAEWVTYLAGGTVIFASLVALQQDNLKRRLAYSTVSQLSYITMLASLHTPLALAAAAVHLVAHACGKITLFFGAGCIYTAQHKSNVSELSGVGRAMPLTMIAFTIGALSMIGVPPAVGFVSKYMMLESTLLAGQWFVVGVIIISTLLNTAYFIPIIYDAFWGEPKETHTGMKEAPPLMLAAILGTAFMTLLLCFLPDSVQQFALMMVRG